MSELRDSSAGTRSAASVFAFSRRDKEHIARRASTLGIACAERRSKAQYVTRTRARESMSTPVSKTKSSHISVGFLFYNYAETTLEKRNRKMRERAYSSEGTRSEALDLCLLFRDDLTRRSPKRSQAAQPPLERCGALRDLASQTKN